jgi:hypothetical protein
MLPEDPAIEQHLEHAYRWIFCASSKPSDRHDQRVLPSGKTVAELVNTSCTTLPDNTAENHGFVHPNYMGSALIQSSFAAVMLAANGRKLPSYTAGHAYEIYQELLKWSDTMGVPLAVQGMDWPYFPITAWPLNHASANIRFKDSAAAKMEMLALDTAEKMMKQNQGQMIPPETKEHCHGQQDPAIFRERQIFRLAFAYLLHRFLGEGTAPADSTELFERQKGVHHYPHGGSVVHVHKHGRSVYSWRNGMMALVCPREGLSLVGQRRGSILAQIGVRGMRLQGRILHQRIREMSDRVTACTVELLENMEESGVFGINNKEILRREVMFTSLPDGETLIYERITAAADIIIDTFSQGMISIINDPIVPVIKKEKQPRQGRSVRTVYHENGINEFEGYACGDNSSDSSLIVSKRKGWVNIDGRLGISYAGDGECVYTNRHFYKVWRAVEDDLEINAHKIPFTCSSGDTVCELVSLWCPEQPPEETGKIKIAMERNNDELRISAGNRQYIWTNQGEPVLLG